ncbi:MAG: response regulator [Defluviitaleaceae bacterium]|nr:response regulator [Defluviitaleaceae bacterium]
MKSPPMRLILVEDNANDRASFFNSAKKGEYINKIQFLAMFNSSEKASAFVKKHKCDGVILDLELNHNGEGSGTDFLKRIRDLGHKPIIVVTTNTRSDLVFASIRNLGVDFIYSKQNRSYCPELVFNELLDLFDTLQGEDIANNTEATKESNEATEESNEFLFSIDEESDDPPLEANDTLGESLKNLENTLMEFADELIPSDLLARNTETPVKEWESLKGEIRNTITQEMDLIGVNVRYKGRAHIEEAVFIMLREKLNPTEKTQAVPPASVIQQVAKSAKISYSSVIRGMKTAIDNTWLASTQEELKTYTARVDKRLGVPTPTEFIHFFFDKIYKGIISNP